ncbi:MAG: hypothetical protein ACXWWK_02100 [Gemmatimonadales bacterium]
MRVGAIALSWDFCHDRLARQAALKTLAWIDLKGTFPAAQDLKDAILAGFGAGSEGGEFVSKLFVPGAGTQFFTTNNGRATLQLEDDAFDRPTLITVRRLSDGFLLRNLPPGVTQDPPYYDYDATNDLTDNTVATHRPRPGSAQMAFCFDADYYEGTSASIGHNPVGGGFEFVPETEITPALEAQLQCFSEVGFGSSGNGLPGFTRHVSSMAKKLFLPAPLYALAVGPRGPIAGLPASLSPFGLVFVTLNNVMLEAHDPGDHFYDEGEIIDTCGEGCTPKFSIQRPSESLVTTATDVTVTLVPDDVYSTGKLSGTRVRTTAAPYWKVNFNDLFVTGSGNFHLVVSAPGANFYRTGSFSVGGE